MLENFKTLKSTAVPLAVENIDTDQIIPARFLKAIERKGFGENLFRDWRYDKSEKKIDSFPLNDTAFSGEILISGKNFGCGSSREHAAWAIYDYGFRICISSYFADIFKNNALNNGLLPIQLKDEQLQNLLNMIQNKPNTLIEVNLEKQKLLIPMEGISWSFDISAYKKECLLNGYDDFSYLNSLLADIEAFENFRQGAF